MPALVARYTTNPVLFISLWIIGGVVSLMGASIYAEMGTRYPSTGGPFVYAQNALGNPYGFITGWANWVFISGVIAYLSIAVAEYTNKLLKVSPPVGLLSSFFIIFLAGIQWQGMRLSSNFQKIMSALKAIGLMFFVIACLFYFFTHPNYQAPEIIDPTPSMSLFPAIILSLRAIYITYGGWNSAVYFTEEDTNPEKNLPRSLIWGVISVMTLFLLVNVALIAVLPLQKISKSVLPAGDAAQLILGRNGNTIVTVISVISLLGILSSVLLFAPRIPFALARAGLFFKFTSKLNKHSIPGNALILTTLVAVVFASTGIFDLVVNLAALLTILVDLSVYISILLVRRRGLLTTPPYKAWGYPYSAIIMITITVGLIVGLFFEDTLNSMYSLLTLALAFPFYFLFKKST